MGLDLVMGSGGSCCHQRGALGSSSTPVRVGGDQLVVSILKYQWGGTEREAKQLGSFSRPHLEGFDPGSE